MAASTAVRASFESYLSGSNQTYRRQLLRRYDYLQRSNFYLSIDGNLISQSNPLDRDSPYEQTVQTQPEKSVSLHAWDQITQWRAQEQGDVGRKLIAELGYFGSGVTGIVETPVRFITALIVGNRVSGGIARVISILIDGVDDGETLKSYNAVKKMLGESCDETIQGVAQNFASMGTNLASHDLNIETSVKIIKALDGKANPMQAFQNINPITMT